MKDDWEDKIFQEEYIRERARIQYREDLERIRANGKNKVHPPFLIGLVLLIAFALISLFGVSFDTISKIIMYFLIIVGTITLSIKVFPFLRIK